MKEIIIKQIKENYRNILTLNEYGWSKDALNNYAAGVSNSLYDIINDLHEKSFITDKEEAEIDEVFSNTIDTLEF